MRYKQVSNVKSKKSSNETLQILTSPDGIVTREKMKIETPKGFKKSCKIKNCACGSFGSKDSLYVHSFCGYWPPESNVLNQDGEHVPSLMLELCFKNKENKRFSYQHEMWFERKIIERMHDRMSEAVEIFIEKIIKPNYFLKCFVERRADNDEWYLDPIDADIFDEEIEIAKRERTRRKASTKEEIDISLEEEEKPEQQEDEDPVEEEQRSEEEKLTPHSKTPIEFLLDHVDKTKVASYLDDEQREKNQQQAVELLTQAAEDAKQEEEIRVQPVEKLVEDNLTSPDDALIPMQEAFQFMEEESSHLEYEKMKENHSILALQTTEVESSHEEDVQNEHQSLNIEQMDEILDSMLEDQESKPEKEPQPENEPQPAPQTEPEPTTAAEKAPEPTEEHSRQETEVFKKPAKIVKRRRDEVDPSIIVEGKRRSNKKEQKNEESSRTRTSSLSKRRKQKKT